jgi:hypothetical protein
MVWLIGASLFWDVSTFHAVRDRPIDSTVGADYGRAAELLP